MKCKEVKKKNKCQDLTYKYNLLLYLIDHIPDVIYFKDIEGRFTLVNQAHAKGLGLKPKDVAGKTDFDIHSKDRAELMVKDDEYVMKTGKSIIDKVERATRADGIDNYVSTTKIPRYDSKGKIIGLMGITRDITRRMQLERIEQDKARIEKKMESLQEVNKMKSEFVSIVSHELRTPLAIIKEAVMLMLDNIAGPISDKQKDLLTKSHDNVERLKKIIDDLLDISRLEGGRFKLQYSLIDLNEVSKDSLSFFKKLARQRGIKLEYRFSKGQINVFADTERVRQVISNLINNAIKFTEEDGEISVEADILDSMVRVTVKDTGIGISSENLGKLFNKFVQVSNKSGVEKKGVGLGLSISRELIGKHGGQMWAESKLGVGSQFYFTLPLFYTERVLSEQLRHSVNSLLKEKVAFYLIDLFVVNYEKFKHIAKPEPEKLFRDLEELLGEVSSEFSQSGKLNLNMFANGVQSGEFSIIAPGATEESVAKVCTEFASRIKEYFTESVQKDVFTNIGIFPPNGKTKVITNGDPNINLKRVYIGLETRCFERISHRLKADIMYSKNKKESVYTVDISQGGFCFRARRPLQKNDQINIGLRLPKAKRSIRAKARVAWIKEMGLPLEKASPRFKTGIEFLTLTDRDKNNLSKFIHSISSSETTPNLLESIN